MPTGELGRYPSPRGRELLAQRLCTVYDLLVQKMGGNVLAARVIQGHLFVRSAPEWSLRVAEGGYTNQSGWLLRLLETYHWYLAERSKDIDRFFSRGAIDTTVVKRTEQANAGTTGARSGDCESAALCRKHAGMLEIDRAVLGAHSWGEPVTLAQHHTSQGEATEDQTTTARVAAG